MRDSIIEALSHLEPEARERILRTVTTFFGIDPPHPQHIQSRSPARTTTDLPVGREPEFGTHPAISPKEFLVEKSPQTDVERVVCLAFYLAHYRDVRYFKTADVSKLNTEAAQRKLANTTYSINTATQAGYIAPATKNAKQLSAMGERFVQALPDHAAAKDIRTSMRPKRARKKTSPRKQNTHIGRDDEE